MDQPVTPLQAPAPDTVSEACEPMSSDNGYGEVPLGVECAWPDRQ